MAVDDQPVRERARPIAGRNAVRTRVAWPRLDCAQSCSSRRDGKAGAGRRLSAMLIGTIKKWNNDRAFGLIKVDDAPRDVFFHIRGVDELDADEIEEGRRVNFDVVLDPKNGKPRAENVKLLT